MAFTMSSTQSRHSSSGVLVVLLKAYKCECGKNICLKLKMIEIPSKFQRRSTYLVAICILNSYRALGQNKHRDCNGN